MSATGPERPDHPAGQPPADQPSADETASYWQPPGYAQSSPGSGSPPSHAQSSPGSGPPPGYGPSPVYSPPPGYGPRPLDPLHTPPPSDERPPLLAALLAVSLVLLIGVAGGVILFVGMAPAATPTPIAASPSPTAAPTPTAGATPTAAPTPTSIAPASPPATSVPGSPPPVGRTPTPDIAAQIEAVVEQVPPIRELEPLRDVPVVLLSRAEFAVELEALLEEEIDPDELALEERLLKRLGLLAPDADLYALLLELYSDQAGAYYRTDTATMYIIERDQPFAAIERVFVAHEYTHALQDQHFGLESLDVTDPTEGDATIAQLAAIEGDASLVMMLWAVEHLSFAEQLELLTAVTPAQQELLDRMPLVLRRQLEFPYSEGLSFASEVHGHGGWEAVNETLTRPPASTEQVIHPQKYLANEEPVPVSVPDLAPALGDGWQRSYEQTMGELSLQIWLADGVYPELSIFPGRPEPWEEAAAGWGGDRLAMYESDTGAWAIAWQIEWDTPADADEFIALAEQLRPTLDGLSLISPVGETTIRLLVAADDATLEALGAAFAE